MAEVEFLKSRGVTELIHFTPINNLPNILKEGLVPRKILEDKGADFIWLDAYRHDGKNHINLSISNPNIKMFYSYRKPNDLDFVVLTLDPSLVSQYHCTYTTTNAASNTAMSSSVEELFSGNRPEGFQDNWTTDNQAEVLVEETISPEYILSIQFPVEGTEPSSRILQHFNQAKQIVYNNKLKAELIIHHGKFVWNPLAVGFGPKETYSAYYQSWKADFTEYEIIAQAVEEYKWFTKFDTKAFSRKEIEELNQKVKSLNRRSIARWKLSFYKPKERYTRAENELSAIAVLEKIILRGRITTISPFLESQISKGSINEAHRIQASIVELLKHQKINTETKLYIDEVVPNAVSRAAINDLKELSKNVCSLYNCDNLLENISLSNDEDSADLILSFGNITERDGAKLALITNLTDKQDVIDFDFTRVQNPVELSVEYETIRFLLEYIFGFDDFRENQIDGILRGLDREDSIVLLPTGSGKSVVYQLLALITPGVAIVVSPIISLIEDQIINLYFRGIDRVIGISSAMDPDDKNDAIEGVKKGQYILTYVSPERFQNIAFLDSIQYYAATNLISVVAIDEAHCVSEWGHSFRTAYLGLAGTCRRVCRTHDAIPPLLALTGTASASVLKDMQYDLGILDEDAVIQPDSFNRPEIIYRIYSVSSQAKRETLENIITDKLPKEFKTEVTDFYQTDRGPETNSGLVFCQNVNGEYGLLASEKGERSGYLGVGNIMESLLPSKVGLYSGKAPNRLNTSGEKWNEIKRTYASMFKHNKSVAMVCTKAFGMGIDKPNIRWIVHYGMPSSLESYYQEVGRAARDKKIAYAYLILSDDHPEFNRELLDPTKTRVEHIHLLDEKVKGGWGRDDVSRSLYFHTSTFDGIENEINRISKVLDSCNKSTWVDKRFRIPFSSNKKFETEQAIYRLQLLGFFKSYSVDYDNFSSGRFVIEAGKINREEIIERYIDYIRAYQDNDEYAGMARRTLESAVANISNDRDFIIKVVETLLREFTYKVVEEGRRRATLNMLEAAKAAAEFETDAKIDAEFRKRLLAYLSTDMKNAPKRTTGLQSIINNATDIQILFQIIRASAPKKKRMNTLGETDRLLEAYPQHYGFHYIKAAMEMGLGNHLKSVDSLQSAHKFGKQNYGLSEERIQEDIIKLLNAKVAENLTASQWSQMIPTLSNLASLSENELYEKIKYEQAQFSRQVNALERIANLVREGRGYR